MRDKVVHGSRHILYAVDKGGQALGGVGPDKISELTHTWLEQIHKSKYTYPDSLMDLEDQDQNYRFVIDSNMGHQV